MNNKLILLPILLLLSFHFSFASDPYQTGLEWKEKGNMVEAYKYFKEAYNANQANMDYTKELANAAYCTQKYLEAIPMYNTLLKNDSKNITYLTRLARMHSFGTQKMKAIEYAEQAVKLKPTDEKQIFELGEVFYFIKNYPKAIEMYSKIEKDNANVILRIAKTYTALNNKRMGIAYYQKYLEFDGENGTVYYELGNALYDTQNPGQALLAYKKADELGFYNFKTLNENIALCHLALNQFDEAIRYYEKAKQASPYDKNLNLDLADAYIKAGKYNDARSLLTSMYEFLPKDAEVIYTYGMTFYKEGKSLKAEQYFNQAFSIDPSLKSLRFKKVNF